MRAASDRFDGTRAVLFDLFHTLTSVDSHSKGLPRTSEVLGIDSDAWNQQLFERSRERLVGELREPVEIVQRLAHAIDPGIPMTRIEEATRIRLERFRNILRGVPSTSRTVLDELKGRGYRLALVSNADIMEAAAWEQSPIAGCFDAVCFSCEVGWAKPEPEIYELALERLAVPADHAMFVGDGGSSELVGARRVGLRPVMMAGVVRTLWPERVSTVRRDADLVIESLGELLPLLRRPAD